MPRPTIFRSSITFAEGGCVMDASGIIAVGAWSLFVAGVLYGISFDVRRWLERRQAQRQVARARQDIADYELQAAYEQALKLAEIEVAMLLPATLACPPEER